MKLTLSPKSLSKIQQQICQKSLEVEKLKNKFADAKSALSNILFYQKKYTIPTPNDSQKYIFTENLNYFKTAKESIWGRGDPDTLAYLNSLSLSLSLSNMVECLRGRRALQ